jgi:large subunit ribosomal protein L3
MVTGIIGRKVGMTQVFGADGVVTPVTVVKAGPCVVVQTKTTTKDGYEAVQLGLVEERPARVNKALSGHYAKANVPPTRVRREVEVAKGSEPVTAGQQIVASMFAEGDVIDVVGTSRGKGFQGVIKRHNFSGGAATHGSMFHRAPGSGGASSFPSRTIKGKKFPGHMGTDRVTMRNLKVVKVDTDQHLLLVRGAIPGAPGGYVIIRKATAPHPAPQIQAEKPGKGGAKPASKPASKPAAKGKK